MANAAERCYVCDCNFDDGKLHENLFDKRYNVHGIELDPMATILSMALGYKLHQSDMHSTQICGSCKVDLLNYKQYQEKLFVARVNIEEEDDTDIVNESNMNPEDGFTGIIPIDMRTDNEDLLTEFEHAEFIVEDPSVLTQERINFDDLIEECPDDSDLEGQVLLQVSFDPRTARQLARGVTEFSCIYCGQKFERRQWLLEHQRVHTGERPHKCDVCNASFAQLANFRTHVRTTHENLATFKCNQCDRAFKRKRLLNNHIKSKHTMVRDLKCNLCDDTFNNPVNLRKHMLRHTGEKRYGCLICGKKFTSPETRNVHHFVHSIRKPFACVVCDMEFMRKQQLVKHIAVSMHDNPNIVRREPVFSAANNSKMQQNAARTGREQLPHTVTTADDDEDIEMLELDAAPGGTNDGEIPHTITSANE